MIIEFQNVTKKYKGTIDPAVENVFFSVEKGEIITLLGPSGCGKTTLLRLLAGLEKQDSGRIIIDGEIVASAQKWVPPEKRGIGMVFQDYALFPHLNVRENVGFSLEGKNKHDISEILNLVGLKKYENKKGECI